MMTYREMAVEATKIAGKELDGTGGGTYLQD